jgi:hypothetical protein
LDWLFIIHLSYPLHSLLSMSTATDPESLDDEILFRTGQPSKPARGYFWVKGLKKVGMACLEQNEFVWGTRDSTELFANRRYPDAEERKTVQIIVIAVGSLDSVGVTMEEAGAMVHGVIESVLLSQVRMPPLGTQVFHPFRRCTMSVDDLENPGYWKDCGKKAVWADMRIPLYICQSCYSRCVPLMQEGYKPYRHS